MYPYHNKIKQRIKNGELIGWYIDDDYPKIGRALVLIFNAEPFKRPIREYRWREYAPILWEKYLQFTGQTIKEVEAQSNNIPSKP